jgi:hypothetical protein
MSTQPLRRATDPKTLVIRNVGYDAGERRRRYVINVELGGDHYHFPEESDTELPEDVALNIQHLHGGHGLIVVHAPETGRIVPPTPPEPPAIEKRKSKKAADDKPVAES